MWWKLISFFGSARSIYMIVALLVGLIGTSVWGNSKANRAEKLETEATLLLASIEAKNAALDALAADLDSLNEIAKQREADAKRNAERQAKRIKSLEDAIRAEPDRRDFLNTPLPDWLLDTKD